METRELAKKAFQSTNGNGNGKSERTIEKFAKNIQSQVSRVTSEVSKITSKVSGDPYLLGGLGCLGISVLLRAAGVSFLGRLVGQAAAPLLAMALYNRVSKLEGSER